MINHPPVITIDSWYKPFGVMGGVLLLYNYPHYRIISRLLDSWETLSSSLAPHSIGNIYIYTYMYICREYKYL